MAEIYQTTKSRLPEFQTGFNRNIGSPENPDYKEEYHSVLPVNQQEGYPIRYFPCDFRLGDPYLPSCQDPKCFSHNGKLYYLPFKSIV